MRFPSCPAGGADTAGKHAPPHGIPAPMSPLDFSPRNCNVCSATNVMTTRHNAQ